MARLVLKDGVSQKQLGALIAQAGRQKGELSGIEQQIRESFDLSAPGFDGVEIRIVYDDVHGDDRIVHIIVPDFGGEDLEQVANEALGDIVVRGCGN